MTSRAQTALLEVQETFFSNDTIREHMTDKDYKDLMDNLMLVYRALPRPVPPRAAPPPRAIQQPPPQHRGERAHVPRGPGIGEIIGRNLTQALMDAAGAPPRSNLEMIAAVGGISDYVAPPPVAAVFPGPLPAPGAAPLPAPVAAAASREGGGEVETYRYNRNDIVPENIGLAPNDIARANIMCTHCRIVKYKREHCCSGMCIFRRQICTGSTTFSLNKVGGIADRLEMNYYDRETGQRHRVTGVGYLIRKYREIRPRRRHYQWIRELVRYLSQTHGISSVEL